MSAVLVTTDNRGVFFGYLEPSDDAAPDTVRLTNARNCVMWDRMTKGYLGLAATGPTDNCRVGPEVPVLKLYGITSVSEVTPAAVAAWEAAPWRTGK